MAGAIFANNVTIKISAAINATATVGGAATTTVYTVPANSYAIVTVCWLANGAGNVKLQNAGSVTTDMSPNVAVSGTTIFKIGDAQNYLGPGQVLKIVSTVGGDYYVTGVCFVNSP